MPGRAKSLKVATQLRAVLARNIRALLLERYPDVGDRVKELSKACGVSRSTVQRVVAVSPAFGANVDTIERIARALRVSAWQLLMEKPTMGGERGSHRRPRGRR